MEIIDDTLLRLTVVPGGAAPPGHGAVVVVKGSFALVDGGPCVPLEAGAQREFSGDETHMDALGRSPRWATDYAPFKPHTDVFAFGTAYAPGGEAAPGFQAGFRLGPLSKEVQVWGPRQWREDGLPGAASPVLRVPLRMELAAGGMGDSRNPFGLGLDANAARAGLLPQIENPAEPVTHRADRPEPCFLGPVPAWFPERARKTGTRDQEWALFRAPLLPEDYDPSIHNAAPFDQQAGNYPRGDEKLTLFNLHPQVSTFKTALPGSRPRVVCLRTDGSGEEVAMRLDTVVLLPDEGQVVLLWRGAVTAASARLLDIAVIRGVMEDVAAAPVAEAELLDAVRALHAAANPAEDTDAMLAEAQGKTMAEVRGLLAGVELPPALRAMVDEGGDADALFEALMAHLRAAVG